MAHLSREKKTRLLGGKKTCVHRKSAFAQRKRRLVQRKVRLMLRVRLALTSTREMWVSSGVRRVVGTPDFPAHPAREGKNEFEIEYCTKSRFSREEANLFKEKVRRFLEVC